MAKQDSKKDANQYGRLFLELQVRLENVRCLNPDVELWVSNANGQMMFHIESYNGISNVGIEDMSPAVWEEVFCEPIEYWERKKERHDRFLELERKREENLAKARALLDNPLGDEEKEWMELRKEYGGKA